MSYTTGSTKALLPLIRWNKYLVLPLTVVTKKTCFVFGVVKPHCYLSSCIPFILHLRTHWLKCKAKIILYVTDLSWWIGRHKLVFSVLRLEQVAWRFLTKALEGILHGMLRVCPCLLQGPKTFDLGWQLHRHHLTCKILWFSRTAHLHILLMPALLGQPSHSWRGKKLVLEWWFAITL